MNDNIKLSISDIEEIFRFTDKIEDEEIKATYIKATKGLWKCLMMFIAVKAESEGFVSRENTVKFLRAIGEL